MRGRPPLVLYVCEEHEWDASVPTVLLEHGGHQVIAATTNEAFSVLMNNPVDAVILDVAGTGHQVGVLKRMKAIKAHIPVALVVDGSTKIHPRKIATADAIMLKDEAPSHLLSVLHDLLNVRYPFFTRWFGNWKYRAHG